MASSRGDGDQNLLDRQRQLRLLYPDVIGGQPERTCNTCNPRGPQTSTMVTINQTAESDSGRTSDQGVSALSMKFGGQSRASLGKGNRGHGSSTGGASTSRGWNEQDAHAGTLASGGRSTSTLPPQGAGHPSRAPGRSQDTGTRANTLGGQRGHHVHHTHRPEVQRTHVVTMQAAPEQQRPRVSQQPVPAAHRSRENSHSEAMPSSGEQPRAEQAHCHHHDHVMVSRHGDRGQPVGAPVLAQPVPAPVHVDNRGVNQNQAGASNQAPGISLNRYEQPEALPDILNDHVPPAYSTHPRNSHYTSPRQPIPGREMEYHSRHRGHSSSASRGVGHQVSRRQQPSPLTDLEGEMLKQCCDPTCCYNCLTVTTTFRWVLVALALLGVCCVVTGIILGALHMTVGSSFLTLSLMFIGLGVMLVIVVGVGWRCTPTGHEPCHLLFSLGVYGARPERYQADGRGQQWYAGMMYPEFRHRRPPPSYNASMQDHQQQVAAAQLRNQQARASSRSHGDNYSLPSSPPPTYRSRASTVRPGIQITFPPPQGEGQYPPTYRSQPGTLDHQRPSLPMDHHPDSGISNLACDGGEMGEGANRSPGGGMSTLGRANRVVEYLDGVLMSQREHSMNRNPQGDYDSHHREHSMDSTGHPEYSSHRRERSVDRSLHSRQSSDSVTRSASLPRSPASINIELSDDEDRVADTPL